MRTRPDGVRRGLRLSLAIGIVAALLMSTLPVGALPAASAVGVRHSARGAHARGALRIVERDPIAGERVHIVGSTPWARGATIALQRRTTTGWATVARDRSDARGRSSLVITMPPAAKLRLSGSGRTTASRAVVAESQQVTLRVPASLAVGGAVTLVASATPARPGRGARLQRLDHGTWVGVATAAQDTAGRLRFPVRFPSVASIRLRVVVGSRGGAAASTSASRSLPVISPSGTTPSSPATSLPTPSASVPAPTAPPLPQQPVTIAPLPQPATTSSTPPAAAPTVASVSPDHGSVLGGERVTITGTDLIGVTEVRFGSATVTAFSDGDATHIVLRAPPSAIGDATITAASPAGTSAAGPTYRFDQPTVSSSAPLPVRSTTDDLSDVAFSYQAPRDAAPGPGGSSVDPAVLTLPVGVPAPQVGDGVLVRPGANADVPAGISAGVLSRTANADGTTTLEVATALTSSTVTSPQMVTTTFASRLGDAGEGSAFGRGFARVARNLDRIGADDPRGTDGTSNDPATDPDAPVSDAALDDVRDGLSCLGGTGQVLQSIKVRAVPRDFAFQYSVDALGTASVTSSFVLALRISGETHGEVTCSISGPGRSIGSSRLIGQIGLSSKMDLTVDGHFDLQRSFLITSGASVTALGVATLATGTTLTPIPQLDHSALSSGSSITVTPSFSIEYTALTLSLQDKHSVTLTLTAFSTDTPGVMRLVGRLTYRRDLAFGMHVGLDVGGASSIFDVSYLPLQRAYGPVEILRFDSTFAADVLAVTPPAGADPELPADADDLQGSWITLSGHISSSLTLDDGVDHHGWIISGLTVDEGATLTIDRGTRLRFRPSVDPVFALQPSVQVRGSVVVQGRADDPVLMTSIDDVAVGGATGLEQPYQGGELHLWSGFSVIPGGHLSISHANLAYSDTLVKQSGSGSTTTLTASTFRGCGTGRMTTRIVSDGDLDVSDMTLCNATIASSGTTTISRVTASATSITTGRQGALTDLSLSSSSYLFVGSRDHTITRLTMSPDSMPIRSTLSGADATWSSVRSPGGTPWVLADGGTIGGAAHLGSALPIAFRTPVVVSPAGSLTIDPGAVLKFGSFKSDYGYTADPSLDVAGTLTVSGTALRTPVLASASDDSVVTATPTNSGYGDMWGGIRIDDGARAVISDADVRGALSVAGGGDLRTNGTVRSVTLRVLSGGSATIRGRLVSASVSASGHIDTQSAVLQSTPLSADSSSIAVDRTRFDGTASTITVTPAAVEGLGSLTFTGGAPSSITVGYGPVPSGDHVWRTSTPLDLTGVLTIGAGTSITLAAGTTIELPSCYRLYVYRTLGACFILTGDGGLHAAGTAESPVRLGYFPFDPSFGPGWIGVSAADQSTVELRHVVSTGGCTLVESSGDADVVADSVSHEHAQCSAMTGSSSVPAVISNSPDLQ